MISEELHIEEVYELLIRDIGKFFKKEGFGKAVIGISGGLDSAVVAALAVNALGNDKVRAFLMPSEFSALHSLQDAVELNDNLNINYDIIPISSIYKRFMRELTPVFETRSEWSRAEENLQSRIRGTLLMAYANKFDALVLNTSNKSNLSTGYGTLYGDLSGSVMVIGDLYKTEVYELAGYINRDEELIPSSIIAKAPSAELKEGEKDSDHFPEYSIIDPILYAINEKGENEETLADQGYDRSVVEDLIKKKKKSEFKLLQLPPLFAVSSHPLLGESKCIRYE
ncbi:MAG: NAD(+) synthase [Bacteroidales bacterium]|jgi:NAD+ synthase (glutamine-hydrolysing)|nr:NAD(+) synthase [Bacteroidales bacterium]